MTHLITVELDDAEFKILCTKAHKKGMLATEYLKWQATLHETQTYNFPILYRKGEDVA